MRVRKENPGSSSHGHEWLEPGDVLDIPVEHATELMRVAPHEFSILPDLEDEEPEAPEGDGGEEPEEERSLVTEPEPKKTARGGRRPRVEE